MGRKGERAMEKLQGFTDHVMLYVKTLVKWLLAAALIGTVGGAVEAEGTGRRCPGGEHGVHVREKGNAGPGLNGMGACREHVAERGHPRFVGGDRRLGDLRRMESGIPHPLTDHFTDAVHVVAVAGEGIHVHQPLQQGEHFWFFVSEPAVNPFFPQREFHFRAPLGYAAALRLARKSS